MKFLALRLAFTAASAAAAAPRITAFNAAGTLTWTNATVPGVSTVETATAQNREAFWRFQFHAHLAAGLVVFNPNSEIELPQKNAKRAAEESFQRKKSDAILHSESARLAWGSLRSLAANFGFRIQAGGEGHPSALRTPQGKAQKLFGGELIFCSKNVFWPAAHDQFHRKK